MRISHIEWDEDTILHIARHGVEHREAEEVCFESNPYILKAKFNRYFALGKTNSSRYLTIVFEYQGNNRAKIITARAMSEAERKLFRRR